MPQNDPFDKERDQLFRSLVKQAKRKGFIRAETVLNRYEKYGLSESEKETLFESFEKENVLIVFSDDEIPQAPDSDKPEFNTEDFYIPDTKSSDAAPADPLRQYLKEIHAYPSLTYKETLALFHKAMEGDKDARERLINCNLKFAYLIAAKYKSCGIPLLDLVQQANIGLMEAIDRYNPNRNTKLTSYAVFWIKQSIFQYIEKQSRSIRLPGYIHAELKKIRELQEEHYRDHQSYLTDDEVATALGKTISRVKYLNSLKTDSISLDDKPDEEMDNTYLDMIKVEDEHQDPFQEIRNADLEKAISGFLEKLPERERKIIKMRYGLYSGTPMSLEEVGAEMNLSRERVRQIESHAMGRLRKMKGITQLYVYLHR